MTVAGGPFDSRFTVGVEALRLNEAEPGSKNVLDTSEQTLDTMGRHLPLALNMATGFPYVKNTNPEAIMNKRYFLCFVVLFVSVCGFGCTITKTTEGSQEDNNNSQNNGFNNSSNNNSFDNNSENNSNVEVNNSSSENNAGQGQPDRGDFVVVHGNADGFEELQNAFQNEEIFEIEANFLNSLFKLPYDVEIRGESCGVANAFYDPNEKSITMCYEMYDYLYQIFDGEEEQNQFTFAAFLFVFYHELGHALLDVYELIQSGREEDVADQFSTWFSIVTDQVGVAVGGALWFGRSNGEGSFADEHGLDQQRYFNIVCWIYGSNPDAYTDLPQQAGLPEERAVRCPGEFGQLDNYFKSNLNSWAAE